MDQHHYSFDPIHLSLNDQRCISVNYLNMAPTGTIYLGFMNLHCIFGLVQLIQDSWIAAIFLLSNWPMAPGSAASLLWSSWSAAQGSAPYLFEPHSVAASLYWSVFTEIHGSAPSLFCPVDLSLLDHRHLFGPSWFGGQHHDVQTQFLLHFLRWALGKKKDHPRIQHIPTPR